MLQSAVFFKSGLAYAGMMPAIHILPILTEMLRFMGPFLQFSVKLARVD